MSTDAWAEHGLIGLIVGALLVLIGYLLKVGMEKFDNASARNLKHLQDVQDEHRAERDRNREHMAHINQQHREERDLHKEERAEWRNDINIVVDKLADAVRNLKDS